MRSPLDGPKDRTANQSRNFVVLAAYQVMLRVGWIFKTESIIIPAFLDAIGGSAVFRGFLPVLHRFGASIPPVLFSHHLTHMRRKKWAVAASSVAMGIPFLVLAGLWLGGVGKTETSTAPWWPWAFLSIYALFFSAVGICRLAMDTVQGKLIDASLRGRLFAIATAVGSPIAIGAAVWKLKPWLTSDGGFGVVFLFSGAMFLAAAGISTCVREFPDNFERGEMTLVGLFRNAWNVLRDDRELRRLATVAALFSIVLMLMPHYQAIGRDRLGLLSPNLMRWVVTQHSGIVVFSLLAGPLADRRGNLSALHYTIAGAAAAPIFVLCLLVLEPSRGGDLFWLVFIPLGLTPVTFRLITNYALELAPPERHPEYVSTLGLCFAMPVIFGAIPVGWLIEAAGYAPVLSGGAVLIAFAWARTFQLADPRHAAPAAEIDGDPLKM